MKVQRLTNPENTRIVLRLDQEPTLIDATILRKLGFAPYQKLPKEFWTRYYPRMMRVAKLVKEHLEAEKPLSEMKLMPDVEPSLKQICAGQYSLVTYQLQDSIKDQYVLFEPFKGVATMIAERYGRSEYGSRLIATNVKPRASRVKVKELFEAGKVLEPQALEVAELAIEESVPNKLESSFTALMQRGLLHLFKLFGSSKCAITNPILLYLQSCSNIYGIHEHALSLAVSIDDHYELSFSLHGPDGFMHDLFAHVPKYAMVGSDGDDALFRLKSQSLWYFIVELAELWHVPPTQVSIHLSKEGDLLELQSYIGNCAVADTPFSLLLNSLLCETESLVRQPHWLADTQPN